MRALSLLLLLPACGLSTIPSKDAATDSGPIGVGADSASQPLDDSDSGEFEGNLAPICDAGADLSGAVGDVIMLDGSASYDPDGDPLVWSWAILSAPGSSTATLINEDRSNPQLYLDREGVWELELTVSDGVVSAQDTVQVVAESANGAPVANAGTDQVVYTGTLVKLDGTMSTDPDGNTLTYAWNFASRPSGSGAALSSTTDSRPTFVPDVAGNYVVQLTVNDGAMSGGPDSVLITAQDEESSGGDDGGSDGCGCSDPLRRELLRYGPLGSGAGSLGMLLPLVWLRRRR